MSWAVGSGREAEIPNTDTPSRVPRSRIAARVSATKRAIDTSGALVRPGNCIDARSPSGRRT